MDTPTPHEQNADQVAYWNGPAGQRWADRQAAQDVLLKPVADLVVERAKLKPGERVIDIGCGSGATAIAFAREVGPSGHVLGVDISGPMLARARQSAPQDLSIDFVPADATVYPFEPASFDVLASRFGVMFFADPALSFANMRKALRPSGRLAFACWREPRENPFFMAPLQAAYKHVPKLPQQGPEDPGPFAFASEARVRGRDGGMSAAAGCRDRPRPRRGGAGGPGDRPGQPRAGWPAGRTPQGRRGFHSRSPDTVRQGRRCAAAGVGVDRDRALRIGLARRFASRNSTLHGVVFAVL
jgi:SAM-dependent methyltransferase